MTTTNIITNDMTITVVKKENPFTPDTKVFNRAKAVLTAKTVEQAKTKGGDAWIVRYMVQNGYVRVAVPKKTATQTNQKAA